MLISVFGGYFVIKALNLKEFINMHHKQESCSVFFYLYVMQVSLSRPENSQNHTSPQTITYSAPRASRDFFVITMFL
ncbi:hypothetical protein BBB57_01360 [Kosakonia sacchari]|nr:hypothetical protein BBB57_01360 [Kosakonia sacchari]